MWHCGEIEIYIPAEDSLFLVEELKKYKGKNALEIGCGSGIVLEILLENFSLVVGTDIDMNIFKYIKEKLHENEFENNIPLKRERFLICCDSVSAITNLKFDLIVSNPPYLPDDKDIKDATIYGGRKGLETPLKFINESMRLINTHGKILVIISSLVSIDDFESQLLKYGIKFKIAKIKNLFFEKLFLYEIEK